MATLPQDTPNFKLPITQTERLMLVRPRSDALGNAGRGGDRGNRTRIKLLTSDAKKSSDRAKDEFGGLFSSTNSANYVMNRLLDSTPGSGWADFLLQNVSVALNEKTQVTQTFGDTDVVYYFGKAPIIFNLAGLLIDDVDNQWFTTFLQTYANVLRGTRLAINYELVQVVFPNMIVTGSISGITINQDAARDTDIPFTMTLIAKSIVPVPLQVDSFFTNYMPNLIDFSAADSAMGFQTQKDINVLRTTYSTIFGPGASLGSFGASSVGSGSTTLDAFRSSLFSPVYGILASLTRVIKSTTGDITKVISSFTNPVRTILRDIQGVATQAQALAKLIENSANQITRLPMGVIQEVNTTISVLKKTKGVISRVPETLSQSVARLVQSGNLKGSAAFLTGGSSKASKAALLNSGKAYTAQSGAKL